MIKFFHQLSEDEFKELLGTGMTWGECAEKYPQPKWCSYPNAVQGEMGCWSLVGFRVYGRGSCKHCEYLQKSKTKP